MQNTLNAIINAIGTNATFAGVATTTNPGVPDGPVFYLASQPGAYFNFNQAVLPSGKMAIFSNFEPEALGLYEGNIIRTDQNGNIYKLMF